MRWVLFALLLLACHEPAPMAPALPAPHPLEPSAENVPAPLPVRPRPVLEGAPAPAPRAPDLSEPLDGNATFVGATKERLLVRLSDHLLVVDRETRCVVEGYPPSPALLQLRSTHEPTAALAQFARPEVQGALRDLAGLIRMYHTRSYDHFVDFAWNDEGTRLFVIVGSQLFRSADAGRTYQPLPAHAPNHLAMSGDGKHVVYDECTREDCNRGRHWVSLAADGSGPPTTLVRDRGNVLAMPADGRSVFAHGDQATCVDTIDLATAKVERSLCLPLPRGARGDSWSQFDAISPQLRYAIVEWYMPRKAGGAAFDYGVVDLATSKVVSRFQGSRGEIDDAGNLVANDEHSSFWLPLRGKRKPLAATTLLVRLGDDVFVRGAPAPEPVPLEERRCDLVRTAAPPP